MQPKSTETGAWRRLSVADEARAFLRVSLRESLLDHKQVLLIVSVPSYPNSVHP